MDSSCSVCQTEIFSVNVWNLTVRGFYQSFFLVIFIISHFGTTGTHLFLVKMFCTSVLQSEDESRYKNYKFILFFAYPCFIWRLKIFCVCSFSTNVFGTFCATCTEAGYPCYISNHFFLNFETFIIFFLVMFFKDDYFLTFMDWPFYELKRSLWFRILKIGRNFGSGWVLIFFLFSTPKSASTSSHRTGLSGIENCKKFGQTELFKKSIKPFRQILHAIFVSDNLGTQNWTEKLHFGCKFFQNRSIALFI